MVIVHWPGPWRHPGGDMNPPSLTSAHATRHQNVETTCPSDYLCFLGTLSVSTEEMFATTLGGGGQVREGQGIPVMDCLVEERVYFRIDICQVYLIQLLFVLYHV